MGLTGSTTATMRLDGVHVPVERRRWFDVIEPDLHAWREVVLGQGDQARIGMLRATNHGVERVFNPDRKDTRWGKR